MNPGWEDYHMHSLNFSDGFNTIDEIVQYAPKVWLRKIAITDHSQVALDVSKMAKKNVRAILNNGRWQNIYNNVEVIFGVEADLLNEEWDISDDIQGFVPDFVFLSAHKRIYQSDYSTINNSYENAIKRHGDKIKFIGHPCSKEWSGIVDIDRLTKFANENNIPLEFDCANFVNKKTDLEALNKMLSQINEIYVNSDSHTLYELTVCRKKWFEYLRENKFID